MVEVNENVVYRYDGRNRRSDKVGGDVSAKSFFNRNWQDLGSVASDVATTCIWDLRYVDDLVLRERNNERLYSLADANWKVVAIADESGTMRERYVDDAFCDEMAKEGWPSPPTSFGPSEVAEVISKDANACKYGCDVKSN